jgi:hypothetical protein
MEDSFDSGWEYGTEFESIADFVAGGNDEVLDEIARSMRVQNIRNGQDLAESYPDGWVNYNRSTKEYEVFADRDEAMQADMPDFTEEARQSLRDYVDNLEYDDPDEYNRILFGNELTADPSELVYAKYFPKGERICLKPHINLEIQRVNCPTIILKIQSILKRLGPT